MRAWIRRFLHKEDGGKYVKFRVKDDVPILAQNGVVLGKNFVLWVEIKKIITIDGNRPRHSHATFIPLHADIKIIHGNLSISLNPEYRTENWEISKIVKFPDS